MPKLEEYAPAGRMHGVRDLAPARHLLIGPYAGRMRVADALGRDRSRFGDDEAGGSALRVIVAHQRVRNPTWAGRSISRQRRHDNAVGNLEIANLQRVEQGGHRGSISGLNARATASKLLG